MTGYNTNSGLVRLIILIVIALLVLSYFNIDIKSTVEKPQTQQNVGYVKGVALNVWNNFLSKPVLYFWNNIFVGLLWSAFQNNIDLIKKGKPPMNFTPNNSNTPAINNGTS